MLSVLRIKNLAIIEEIEVELGEGCNVVTGETGAGKSVFLKAIELITGKRASSDLVRKGENLCEIEAIFALEESDREILRAFGEEFSDDAENEELLVRRVIDSKGKSKAYLNGRLSTAAILQQVCGCLVDITSQHQQQILTNINDHRSLVDRYGISKGLLSDVQEKYAVYAEAKRQLDSFVNEKDEQTQRIEQLRFVFEQLDKAQLKEGERDELEAELERLSHVEDLGLLASESQQLIDDEDGGIFTRVSRLRDVAGRALSLDPSLKETVELVETSYVNLQEVSIALDDYASSLEADPQRLEFLRERIAEIAALERKFSKPLAELIAYRDSISEELSLHDSGKFDLDSLQQRVDETKKELGVVEVKLTAERKKIAAKLEKLVEQELAKLNMKQAKFEVNIQDCDSTAFGKDRVEFLLSANPGEPTRALSKVASGGELSRILLVLKTVLSERSGASLQIFDEIDTGVGGAVAHVVGEKLKQVSEFTQVLLVTHAPQIAAFADQHFIVEKSSSKSSTSTTVRKLNDDQRVSEVARMLAGKEVTKEFETSARELLGKAA